MTETVNGESWSVSYSYNGDGQAAGVSGAVTGSRSYDGYGRLSLRAAGPLSTGYSYRELSEDRTGTQVAELVNSYGGSARSLSYSYDGNGNILRVTDGTNSTRYSYDGYGQLVREDNQEAGKTWTWSYDTGGNLLSRREYAYSPGELGEEISSVSYSYGDGDWGDLLTGYNGESVGSDGIGNITSLGGWTLSWQGGRELAGMSREGASLTFGYNEAGQRTRKTTGESTHRYLYRGEQLAADIAGDDALYFRYDAAGEVLGFYRKLGENEANYTYVKNVQGDVLAVVDDGGRRRRYTATTPGDGS